MDKAEFQNKLGRFVIDATCFLIGTGNGEPEFNISEREGKDTAKYAVKLFPNKDVFIVWDIQRHRKKDAGMSSLGLTDNTWDKIPVGPDVFEPCYKELKKPYSGIYEKIYIVGTSHFERFFKNYASYMKLNEDDDEYPHNINTDNASLWVNADERKKYSSSQYKREKKFREEVLEAYNFQCAICRCGILNVLQAAHEHGYEVCSTPYDDSKHGICLCANHHLMYDSNVIDVNLKTGAVEILEYTDEIINSVWYEEFLEKYDGKIKERK